MRLGLIGLGAIGGELLRCLAAVGPDVEVTGALVRDAAKRRGGAVPVFTDPVAFLTSRPDLVVECASQAAFRAWVPTILAAGLDVIAGSVGALADEQVHADVEAAARAGRCALHIPAGALAGIDALAAAKLVGIDAVTYTRSAPPSTWAGHEAVRGVDLAALDAPHLVFAGTAREAARRFPKNANVAAAIALAGIGFEKTRVRIHADPAVAANVHTIEAQGLFGRLHTELSATRISPASTSSRIVAASLARSVLCRTRRIAI
jgi:aspartate dehydrogenase